ncbi:hypothetical protein JOF36_007582 [Pseudonocardia parietis]|uniref:Homeodomain-like domain-containing protein n=1 Tax=Pseudonocardia parietis TaxID=570936 RepID=A0ABS4W6H4_9PSEU|nr:hypothetical protein [Pseudonocardia parietis]
MGGATSCAQIRAALEAVESADTVTARVSAGRRLRQVAEQLEAELVAQARAEGVRWVDIGQLYGTSKQGVQQRFRRRTA